MVKSSLSYGLSKLGSFSDVQFPRFILELRVAKFASEQKSILYEYDVRSVLRLLNDNQLADMQDPMGFQDTLLHVPLRRSGKMPFQSFRRHLFGQKSADKNLQREISRVLLIIGGSFITLSFHLFIIDESDTNSPK